MTCISGLERDDTAIKVCNVPGRTGRYICVQKKNNLVAVARITSIIAEETFLQALQYVALGTEGEA